jgi:hypothetical protein
MFLLIIIGASNVFKNNFGIRGVYLVFGSRDYFTAFDENGITGIRVSNSCGSFIVGVQTSK